MKVIGADSKKDVFSEMSERLSAAANASLTVTFLAYSLSRALFIACMHYINVLIPFAKDVWFCFVEYFEPFLRNRILIPLYFHMYPVLLFLLNQCKLIFFWFARHVALEYQLSVLFTLVLASTRRLDPFVKTHLLLCVLFLFSYSYAAPLLTNETLKGICFLFIPFSVALHAVAVKGTTIPPSRLANLLLYFAFYPVVVATIGYLKISHFAPSVFASMGLASLFSILYWIDTPYFTNDVCMVLEKIGTLSLPALWVRARVLADATSVIQTRFPQIHSFFKNMNALRDMSSSLNVLSRTLVSGQTGLTQKILTVVRSVTLLKLAIITLIVVSVAVYFLHVAVTNLVIFAIWPWWFHGALKTVFYKRKEDLNSQLSFTLLFLFLELLNSSYKKKTDLIGFLLSVVHVPLVLLFRIAPSVILKTICKALLFVPLMFAKVLFFQRGESRKIDNPAELIPAEPDPRPVSHASQVRNRKSNVSESLN